MANKTLVKVVANVEKRERERIVKLLSDRYGYCSANDAPEHEECYGWIEAPIYKVIAVIRGEDID